MKTEVSAFKLLSSLYSTPQETPLQSFMDVHRKALSQSDKHSLQRIGMTMSSLSDTVARSSSVAYQRRLIYEEVERAMTFWMMSAALGLYADYSTTVSTLNNKSIWVVSENPVYETKLNDMLNRVGAEEKVYDWAWSSAAYGDLFAKVHAQANLGVVALDDSMSPLCISRVDHNGTLIGFFETPDLAPSTSCSTNLIPPWHYLHFRLTGAKKRRSIYSNYGADEFSVQMMGPDSRVMTTSYGTSILLDAFPAYKRLRMSEDALLLARLTRGVVKYIYKIAVSPTNVEAVSELMDEYTTLLKSARAMSSTSGNTGFSERMDLPSAIEDIILPVWGDAGDVQIEEIGGKADVKWITDVDHLRKALASVLGLPLSLLGGYADESSGALGATSMEKLDIRFARTVRRIQRTVRDGVTRLCQIHLAWEGLDPDYKLFDVQMAETSTAEEESLKESLDTGMDIVQKFFDTFEGLELDYNKIEMFDYLNDKILRLNDLDLSAFITADKLSANEKKSLGELRARIAKKKSSLLEHGKAMTNVDFVAALPTTVSKLNEQCEPQWASRFGGRPLLVTRKKEQAAT